MKTHSAQPGERWLVNLQPIDAAAQNTNEVVVTLKDYDPRTDTWTVQPEGSTQSIGVQAKHLMKRLS